MVLAELDEEAIDYADAVGGKGVRDIAGKFDHAGLPLPCRVELPAGQDLNDFLRGGKMESIKEGRPP